jgi:N-acetylglucosamine-6-phosphate deacetylase
MKTAITAARLYTPTQAIDSPLVIIEDQHIVSAASRAAGSVPKGARQLDFPGMVLAPGFIDIHIHGGAGHDVMERDDSAIAEIERHMLRHGVTSYLPTTVTAPLKRTLTALEHLGNRISNRASSPDRAFPLGIHLEGPFISHAKCGVHPTQHLLEPSVNVFDRFWQAASGTIRMMTIAPELSAAQEVIGYASGLGVLVSMGHSDATYDETFAGIAAGASHATHTFNAMRALGHRDPGILGAVLTDARVSADIIADGLHLAPSIVKLFLAAKGPDRAILITDAISATGMPDGKYSLGEIEVEVKGARCDFQGKLAGSVLTLDHAVRNVMTFAEWSLQQALQLATLNPARVLGISDQRGTIAAGRVADLVVLTPGGEVVKTIVAGRATNS